MEIIDEDTPSQRFLCTACSQHGPVEVFQMNRMIFRADCSLTIAQYVKNKNADKFKKKFPRAAEAIIKRHHVDEYVDCFDTVEEARKVLWR